jgi:hypothetical protein
MNLTRVTRQFHVAPGVTEQLAADFILPMVTMGPISRLPACRVLAPPSIVAPAVSLEDAKARGWEVVPGLPQPPEPA